METAEKQSLSMKGLTSGVWAAYLDKYAEVKEFTFNRC
jgi:hypothetical protein